MEIDCLQKQARFSAIVLVDLIGLNLLICYFSADVWSSLSMCNDVQLCLALRGLYMLVRDNASLVPRSHVWITHYAQPYNMSIKG